VQNYTDIEILQGIKAHDNQILKYLYKTFFPIVELFITKNNGTLDEAKDVFQEAVIIIYGKIRNDELIIKKSFRSYFMVMIKLIWFKKMKREPKKSNDKELFENIIDDNDDLEFKYEEAKKYNLFQKHFKKLRDDCKQILTLVLQKMPLNMIANKLGLKSENYIKKRKHKCKEFLVDSIKSDPEYKNIYHP
jgi:RNA polymerase sigma factor (sigma-70 family)